MLQRRVGKLRPEFNRTVLINQTQFDSTYFRLDDIPDELTSGKNMFKIYGNNQVLQPGTEILIQVTDINGSAVYHHVNNYVDSTGRLVVGIWVYPETPPGLGKIEILGIASRRPDGRSIPRNWRNRYNIKWTREIIIKPDSPNDTPIIFQTIPGVKIFEYEREYLTQTYTMGSSIASQSIGGVIYNYSGFGDATLTIAGANFSASMVGGLITIPEPDFTLPTGYTYQTNTVIDSGNNPTYQSYISQIINNTTVKVDPYVVPVQSTAQVSYVNQSTTRNNTGTSTVNSAYPVTSFGTSPYTIEWQQDAQYASGSMNSQSFASVTLKNIDPIVGKVHKIKTLMKSHGFANYQTVNEEILQERDLLININSSLAYDRMGDFKSQELINEYWDTSVPNQPGAVAHVTHSDVQMISSMLISGSAQLSASTNYPSTPLSTDPFIKVATKTGVDLYQHNEYQVKFKVVAEAVDTAQTRSSYLDVYISGSGIGATDERNLGHKLVKLETTNVAPQYVTNVAQYVGIANQVMASGPINSPAMNGIPNRSPGLNSTIALPANFSPNTTQQVNPNSLPGMDESLLEVTFTPDVDTDAYIVFAVTRGHWYLSDVSLEGASDHGFTPNHTFFEFPIQTTQADDVLDFKFEFYNTVNQIANVTLTTQSLDFVGSNTFISGNNNVLSGSVSIGNGIIMQGFRAS